MADIDLRVLGPLRIEVDGRLMPAGSPKTRAVLALLLISQPSGYCIAHKQVRTDVGRFGELLQQGRELLRQGAAGPAVDRLRAAQALWHGPAYTDVAVAAVRYAADVLNGQRLDAVEATAHADLALGEHEAVARELSPLVAQHPLREPV
jgi:DNA-binding SARP family transcriptional activator